MAVSEVLQVASQGLAEVAEVFLLQGLHQLQHFGFGVRAFQRQALFMQHAAEQGAVEQAEGSAWLFIPEPLNFTGNIRWQALWRHFQAEQLFWRLIGAPLWQTQAPGKGAQPVAVAPQQPGNQAKDRK